MKKFYLSCIFVFSVLASAEEFAVVSNGSVEKLSVYEIKAVFLKQMKFYKGLRLVPVNLYPKSDLRRKFESDVLQMSFPRLRAYWNKKHYMGVRPPLTMRSKESVKRFIKQVDGAVGYIPLRDVDKDLYVIYRWSEK